MVLNREEMLKFIRGVSR